MQMIGQVECKWVGKSVQLPTTRLGSLMGYAAVGRRLAHQCYRKL